MNLNHDKDGVTYAVLSYLMWGFTPIYWKLVHHVAPGEILAQRVFWSFIFMLILLLITKNWRTYITFVKEIMKKPSLFWSLFTASVLISANWGIFMWAVIDGKIVEASLGQYINPLTSLLLIGSGMVTALPLLLFTKSAKKVSLSMLGILQYISPTLSLLAGVILYHESLTKAHVIAFNFIWLALIIYTFSSIAKWENKKHIKNKIEA
ncbi:EamA family transporter [Priestia sp. Y58]|nr:MULTISPECIES: EamA family transporter [Priestia]MCZ8496144.1 EamA family transporter [Priestia megaterium]MDG0032592.1 EamA family transporter [Priestia sp. Y58]MDG0061871.1 EamA family transporter [Priestia sp. P5]